MTRGRPALTLLLALAALAAGCASGGGRRALPGRFGDGTVLLPNGWRLSPHGRQIPLGDLPLALDVHPGGRYAAATLNGAGDQGIAVVDLERGKRTQTVPLPKAWLGIRFYDEGRRLAASGGNDNRVYLFAFANGRLGAADTVKLGEPWPKEKIWPGSLDVDDAAGRLYVAARGTRELIAVDLAARRAGARLALPGTPYACLVSRRGGPVYVSLWSDSAVAFVDRATFAVTRTVPVGSHPTDLVESPDGTRLFVANANVNTVSVVDVASGRVTETLSAALRPTAPPGSTPNSVALSADGSRLYIADADNNCLALFDVARPGDSRALGFIPVGWYPTCVRVAGASGRILVANGKGAASMANPGGPIPGVDNPHEQYIGTLLQGTLSTMEPPSAEELARSTAEVYRNTPWSEERESDPGRAWEPGRAADAGPPANPIPARAGDPSPVKHVFYIIRENRSYDQVLGDLARGNGDPDLTLFPERVTPNAHALAREFVLLDNFYVDAEVSADGHNWSMGAYATDYVEKSWPTIYGDRGGDYDFEGGALATPAAGYLWDLCARHGVSYRSYGEFAVNPKDSLGEVAAGVPGLQGHVAPHFRGWDLKVSDLDRLREWQEEFDAYDRDGGLPSLEIIRLPNDHTAGARTGYLTPGAYAAQNDLALGLMVERISRSRYWPESVIFVVEDDAQDGPDHVDAHRSVALVVSPRVRRGAVVSELYSTSGMLRTMELILGLPPLTQYDAAATPFYACFTPAPDAAPYTHRAALQNLEERNPLGAVGQAESDAMDLAREDAVPDALLGEIVWKAVRGADSVMPAPVRSAFVRRD